MEAPNTSVIVPTVLVDNTKSFQAAIEQIKTFTARMQIDITDGKFADSKTVTLDQVWWPEGWVADIHMMVAKPSQYVKQLIKMRPHLVIFHAEVDEDLNPVFEQLKDAGIKTGLALLRPTVPKNHSQLIEKVDHVLIFAGSLGKMGGTASLIQTEKIRLVKKINPEVEVGWDGGANVDNVFTISRGGADVINVGGALAFANDPRAVYKSLLEQVSKTSVV